MSDDKGNLEKLDKRSKGCKYLQIFVWSKTKQEKSWNTIQKIYQANEMPNLSRITIVQNWPNKEAHSFFSMEKNNSSISFAYFCYQRVEYQGFLPKITRKCSSKKYLERK